MLQRGDDIFIRTGKRARFKHIADGFVINKQPGRRVVIPVRKDTAELGKFMLPSVSLALADSSGSFSAETSEFTACATVSMMLLLMRAFLNTF
jgi:hypothetical protein